MSQETYLSWYSNRSGMDFVQLLKEIPRIVGFEQADFVWCREVGASLNDPPVESARDVSANDLWKFYAQDRVVSISADFAKLGEFIEDALIRQIPLDIRGDCMTNRPFLEFGPSSWADSGDEGPPTPCQAQIECWGYSTPSDGEEFKRLVTSLPEVLQVKRDLELLMGPLEIVCYFIY